MAFMKLPNVYIVTGKEWVEYGFGGECNYGV